MHYSIRLTWNGTDVLEGRSTLVAGFDTVEAFIRGAFAGLHHRQWCDARLTLDVACRELRDCGSFVVAYSDATGIAAVEILPL